MKGKQSMCWPCSVFGSEGSRGECSERIGTVGTFVVAPQSSARINKRFVWRWMLRAVVFPVKAREERCHSLAGWQKHGEHFRVMLCSWACCAQQEQRCGWKGLKPLRDKKKEKENRMPWHLERLRWELMQRWFLKAIPEGSDRCTSSLPCRM